MDGGLRGPHYIISWQLRYLKGGAEGEEAEEGNMWLLLKMAFGEYSQGQRRYNSAEAKESDSFT